MFDSDRYFYNHIYGLKTCHDFYIHESMEGRLKDIKCPTLAIYTKDDVVSETRQYKMESFTSNPNIIFAMFKHGGHKGMFEGWKPKRFY